MVINHIHQNNYQTKQPHYPTTETIVFSCSCNKLQVLVIPKLWGNDTSHTVITLISSQNEYSDIIIIIILHSKHI